VGRVLMGLGRTGIASYSLRNGVLETQTPLKVPRISRSKPLFIHRLMQFFALANRIMRISGDYFGTIPNHSAAATGRIRFR